MVANLQKTEVNNLMRMPRQPIWLAPKHRQPLMDNIVVNSSSIKICSPKRVARLPPRPWSSSTSSSSRERPSYQVSRLSCYLPIVGLGLSRFRKVGHPTRSPPASSKLISQQSFSPLRSSKVPLRSRLTCLQLDLGLAPFERVEAC